MDANEELKKEIERENFIRAAAIGEELNLSQDRIKELRYKAICRMAVSRNSNGMLELAKQYGFSPEETNHILKEFINNMKNESDKKHLDPCYDFKTGKYLSLEEWIANYPAR